MTLTELIAVSIVGIALVIIFFNFYNPEYKTVKVKVGYYTVTADIADSIPKKTKGLMGRKSLPEDKGMLFTFRDNDKPSFWMMNMSIPIDMIWISSDGKVTYIAKDAQPCLVNCKLYSPDKESKYVLEVASNFTDRHNVKMGTKVEINL